MLSFIDLKKQYETLKTDIDAAIEKVLDDGRYINGEEVSNLEDALADYTKSSNVVSCANGTDALTLPLLYWGVGPGDAVFCPAFTFIATAEVIVLRGATPIFVDIDPVTFNMSPKSLAAKIEMVNKENVLKPKAVITVDLFGLPCNYLEIEQIAKAANLKILEDAAQGFGGSINGRQACTFGDAASTSFFPAKPLGCYGDGGAIFTNDKEMANALKSIRTHGSGSHKYEHYRLGMNSRLDTIQAAILSVKLAAFPEELEKRQKVVAMYNEILKDKVITPTVPENYISSWAQYTIKVPAERRTTIMSKMAQESIPTAIYYPKPLHLQPVFAAYGGKEGQLRETEKACKEVLSLPMHPYLTEDKIQLVCSTLLKAL